MSPSSLIAVLAGLLLLVLGKVCLDLASQQVQGSLFDLCFVVLRVARRRLPAELRVAVHDEELVPELKWILFDKYENQPIVGLYKGFRFALGHVRGAKKLARESGEQSPGPRAKATRASARIATLSLGIAAATFALNATGIMDNANGPGDRARGLLQERVNDKAESANLLSQQQASSHQTAMSIINNIPK